MQNLIISKPWVEDCDNTCKLRADFIQNNDKYEFYYEYDARMKPYITTEVVDGLVVTLLPYCLRKGLNIQSDTPISKRLLYQLNNFLIPALTKNVDIYHSIEIQCEPFEGELPRGEHIGLGFSGGVDSFYSLEKNGEGSLYPVTDLAYYNVGACGDAGDERAHEVFRGRAAWVEGITESMHMPLVKVDSNISEFLQIPHEESITFRTLGVPLTLQKYFKTYYASSTYEFTQFHYCQYPEYSDLLNIQCLSTDNLKFYSVGGEVDRVQKVKAIAHNKYAQKHLNVCVNDATNCSRCWKCKSTMLELYVEDALDEFHDVFDVEYFHKNKHDFFADAIAFRHSWNAIFWDELYKELRARNELRFADYWIATGRRISYAIRMNKLVRKIYFGIKGK